MCNQLIDDNNIVFRTLGLLNRLYEMYGDGFYKTHYARAKFLQKLKNINLPIAEAAEIWKLLDDAEIRKIKENVYKILHPEVDMNNVNPADIKKVRITDLSATQLVNYFGLYCQSVFYTEKGHIEIVETK